MKSNNKKLAARILLMLALGLYNAMPVAYALPSQGSLDNSKAASITTSEKLMTITGKGNNNILNCYTKIRVIFLVKNEQVL